ncbi:adenylosuccinate lyase family protein [Bradyrhizobium sp. STM 3561]|uniref:class-II fumarase/aspartase family protein n=1 Tax=Bradyrhizobium sp. STM 3561 TaxID=578923 RepID=UPI00388F4257
MLSSHIFRNMFGDDEMRDIFSDKSLVQRYLEVEVALARAEANAGIVPPQAAVAIESASRQLSVDLERLQRETENVGYPILGIVHQLAEAAGDAGGFVHWGATTQDIMDTATVLQIRRALELLNQKLMVIRASMVRLAARHRDTPMAGRTHLQQALPITFGYKVAVWLSMIDRHLTRLTDLRRRVLVGSFSGAAGTLASLGDKGLEVQAALCEELGLAQPTITWHVARDGVAETIAVLGLITASLAKVATDVMLMMSTEFGEVSEPFVQGRGASSTMPQKRNPISCELILATSKAVRQHVGLILDAMVQDFERATGPWHLEWIAVPESFILTAAACSHMIFMLGGLSVDAKRMRENLSLTSGLIVAEAVMMAAAPKLGRQRAHDIVYVACREARERASRLQDVLLATPEIVEALGGAEAVERHCDPVNYLGLSGKMVDRVLSLNPGAQSPSG